MKKILAILLTVCMVIWMIPATAFAVEGESGNENLIDLTQVTISINNGSKDYYTAEEVKADNFLTTYSEVSVKNGIETIDSGNYVVSKVNTGDKIRITINFVEGKSKGTNFKDFNIVSETLNNTDYFISSSADAKTATAIVDSKVYTGAKITPAIYVYKKAADSKSANVVVPSSKYTVEYSNNINVGNAGILVKGKGTVGGEIGGVFAITPANFSAVAITAPDTKVTTIADYDVTVKLNGNTLKKDTDYTLSFKDNDGNAFTGDFVPGNKYTVVVTPKTNFTEDSKAREYSFKVNSEFAGADEISITNTSFTYNGQKQVPTVTVKKDGKTVTAGYKVTYYDASGKQVASPINAGSYTVVVEAVENNTQGFSGTKEASFVIDKVDVQSTKSTDNNYVYISGLTDQKYTAGAVLRPSFTVYYKATPSSSAKALTKDTDYTVSYSNNTSIGTGRVAVSFTGNYRNSGSDLTGTFTISNGTLLNSANTTISGVNDTYDYTGYAIKPTVYVTYKSGYTTKALTQSTATRTYDYKVDYSSNIAAGTATITVTGQGEYTGTVTKTFKIKYNLSNATVTATPSTYLYDGKEKKPLVSVKVGYMIVPASNYNVVYSNNTNTGTAAVTVTANKYGNAIGSNSAYFTIKGKDGVITPEYAEYSKKTTKSKPFAIKIVSNTTDGTGYSYVSSDTSVATVSANGTVTPVGCGRTVITITTTGNKAYNPATATVTVTVKPTKGIISSLKSTAKGKLTVRYKKQSPNADYYQIRYGRAGDYTTKTIKNTSARTGKSTIKGLQSGKKYFIKVRGVKVLEDGTRLYGAWSVTKNAVTK